MKINIETFKMLIKDYRNLIEINNDMIITIKRIALNSYGKKNYNLVRQCKETVEVLNEENKIFYKEIKKLRTFK